MDKPRMTNKQSRMLNRLRKQGKKVSINNTNQPSSELPPPGVTVVDSSNGEPMLLARINSPCSSGPILTPIVRPNYHYVEEITPFTEDDWDKLVKHLDSKQKEKEGYR